MAGEVGCDGAVAGCPGAVVEEGRELVCEDTSVSASRRTSKKGGTGSRVRDGHMLGSLLGIISHWSSRPARPKTCEQYFIAARHSTSMDSRPKAPPHTWSWNFDMAALLGGRLGG